MIDIDKLTSQLNDDDKQDFITAVRGIHRFLRERNMLNEYSIMCNESSYMTFNTLYHDDRCSQCIMTKMLYHFKLFAKNYVLPLSIVWRIFMNCITYSPHLQTRHFELKDDVKNYMKNTYHILDSQAKWIIPNYQRKKMT